MPSIIDITTEKLNSTDIRRKTQKVRFIKVSFNIQLLFAINSHKEKDQNETKQSQHLLILHTAHTTSNDHVLESSCKVIANISL